MGVPVRVGDEEDVGEAVDVVVGARDGIAVRVGGRVGGKVGCWVAVQVGLKVGKFPPSEAKPTVINPMQ